MSVNVVIILALILVGLALICGWALWQVKKRLDRLSQPRPDIDAAIERLEALRSETIETTSSLQHELEILRLGGPR